jgi:hypothetical protein
VVNGAAARFAPLARARAAGGGAVGAYVEVAAVAGVTAIAAWLRFRDLGLLEFKSDEALAVRIGRDILHGDIRTVGLTSSAGAANPPLFVYLTALPLSIWNSPVGATAFVGLVSTVTVPLTYLLLRGRFGRLVAIAAAGLFATAPWSVLYGRHLWQPDVLPIVTLALLRALFAVLERDRSRLTALVPVCLSVALQLNFSTLALFVPAAAVLAYRGRAVHWRAAGYGTGAAVLLLAPWLAHDAKHGFRDFVALATEGRGHGGTPGAGTVEAIRQTIHLASAEGWSFVTGASQSSFVHAFPVAERIGRVAGLATVVLLVLGLLGCCAAIRRGARRRRGWPRFELDAGAARRAVLLVWLAGVWLSYAASATSKVSPHYLIATYPVTFALAGIGLADGLHLAGNRRTAAALAGSLATLAVMGAFVAFSLAFQHFLARRGGTAGDYGVIYDDQAAFARTARARDADVDDRVLEFLTTGESTPRPGSNRPLATVRDRLVDRRPLRCAGRRLAFGPLAGCFPR